MTFYLKKYLLFSHRTINWFKLHLLSINFWVNVQGKYSCINIIVDCDLFRYSDHSCLVYHHKDVKEIERNLNKNFSDVSDSFVDNKLNIHFGENKTKCMLSGTKQTSESQ